MLMDFERENVCGFICMYTILCVTLGSPGEPAGKTPPAMKEMWARSLGREDPLEEEVATQSSILAWRIPWTEEPGGLWTTGWQRVGHNLPTEHARTYLTPVQSTYTLPEESRR